MTEPQTKKRRENWILYLPLWIASAIFAIGGALVAYWIVHEYFGYHGNKSTVFYIGGGLAGYMLVEPLWILYRRRHPKSD